MGWVKLLIQGFSSSGNPLPVKLILDATTSSLLLTNYQQHVISGWSIEYISTR